MKPPSDDDNNGKDRPDAPQCPDGDAPSLDAVEDTFKKMEDCIDDIRGQIGRYEMGVCVIRMEIASMRIDGHLMFLELQLAMTEAFFRGPGDPHGRFDAAPDGMDECLGGMAVMAAGWVLAVAMGAAVMLRWIAAMPGIGG